MAVPALLGSLLGRSLATRSLTVGSIGLGIGSFRRGGGQKKRRRRKARLTQSEFIELMRIKDLLGRTAAANAMPFYLGRGR